jgi:poly(3-hydroxybutyrate) depolymerase
MRHKSSAGRTAAASARKFLIKRWTACRAGSAVVLVEIDGGGHRIPGREDRPHPLIDLAFGVQNHAIEASEVIWRFFAPALLREAEARR